jgi:hypothetical protein
VDVGNWPVAAGNWPVGSSPGNGRGLAGNWLAAGNCPVVVAGNWLEAGVVVAWSPELGKSSKSSSSAAAASRAESSENRPVASAPKKMMRMPTPTKKPSSSRKPQVAEGIRPRR